MWKVIEGHENYSISDTGVVKNNTNGKILKPFETYNKYLRVNLNGKYLRIHLLVANAFLQNRKGDCNQINHIDGNKANNNVSNLEWCTAKENIRHAHAIGIKPINYKNIQYPKAIIQTDLNDNFIAKYESTMEVQRILGFNNSNVSKVCRGVQRTAYGYKWHYAI